MLDSTHVVRNFRPGDVVLELVALQTDSDFSSVHRLRTFSHAS